VARNKQEQLERLNPALRKSIQQEQQLSGSLVIPLLAFPGFTPEGDLTGLMDNEAQLAIYARCRVLLTVPGAANDTFAAAHAYNGA
jgi:hypothetical protein